MTTRTNFLSILFLLQVFCVSFFLLDLISDVPEIGVETLNESAGFGEYFEAIVTLCLVLSTIFTGLEIRSLFRSEKKLRQQISLVSGAFAGIIEQQFDEWQLTEAERVVALMGIKGYSIKDIANMRNTAEGTIKAQCAAVYKKANVTGRLQLISHFVEDLVADFDLPEAPVK